MNQSERCAALYSENAHERQDVRYGSFLGEGGTPFCVAWAAAGVPGWAIVGVSLSQSPRLAPVFGCGAGKPFAQNALGVVLAGE